MNDQDRHFLAERLLAHWQNEPNVSSNISTCQVFPGQSPVYANFPPTLMPSLRSALEQMGITQLYSHQAAAFDVLGNGQHLVVATGTASGKTLCYNLPILNTCTMDPSARALYLFPTKALTQDQFQQLSHLVNAIPPMGGSEIPVAIYDGDTRNSLRRPIRQKTRLLLTNPDMLHMGILPHHTLWAEMMRNLRYVVIDEMHIYRGVFGSHIANVIRRLKRIAQFYGSFPQFILTSATIANPLQLAECLIESQAHLVEEDGSPHGTRYFLLYNPPIIHPELGIRRSAMAESISLAEDLITYQVQTLLFARARRTVELILKSLQSLQGVQSEQNLHGYRSGYLPRERRAIEQQLRSGKARVVVATNALELGIDIGGVGAVLMVGYPGTIAATRQQAGRAGRRSESSLAVLIASSNPLDQFLIRHPKFIFDRSPEKALVNPDNLLILLQHLRCAAFELPFRQNEGFGSVTAELFQELINFLVQSGILHASGGRYFWRADEYPADQVSLRSTSAQPVVLQAIVEDHWVTIGEVDQNSAPWMVHPAAIYLHAGNMYKVEHLSIEDHHAQLVPVQVDYYTEPIRQTEIERLSTVRESPVPAGNKSYGEILVTSQVVGYKSIDWFTHEILHQAELDLLPSQLRTMACWVTLDELSVNILRESGLWKNDPNDYGADWNRQRTLARQRDGYACQMCGMVEKDQAHHVHHKIPFRNFSSYLEANRLENLLTLCPACHKRAEAVIKMRSGLAGLSYVFQQLAPLILMCDISDLGTFADSESTFADGRPVVVIYDQIPAGIGLSESLYENHHDIIQQCYDLVSTCPCEDGCPSCVGPSGENGAGGKQATLAILSLLLGNVL